MIRTCRRRLWMAAQATLAALCLAGCREEPTPEWKQLQLVFVDRPESIAMTSLVKVVLEDRMELTVQTSEQTLSAAFTMVADGKADAFLDAWLPTTHDAFLRQHEGKLVEVAVNYAGARVGLVVPAFVTIDSIHQLGPNKEAFGGDILTVDPESGVGAMTDSVIERYKLEFEPLAVTSAAAMSALREAVATERWIVLTGWQPHPMFDLFAVKFLVDTLGIYATTENIHTVARKDLDSDKPEVYQFLRAFQLTSEQLGSLMRMIADPAAASPEEEARAWAVLNRDAVDAWIPAGP